MDSEGSSSGLPGSDNSNEPAPPGIAITAQMGSSTPVPTPRKLLPSSKGVENAKKRLRAFSIQKKTPVTPAPLSKPTAAGSTTVVIGKLSSVKVTPKVEPTDDQKKLPKPPKPGSSRKNIQDSYTELQKRTLSEIEDMKRKMELVELGIPLGLICPGSINEKAMPTKAMPPIKSFLEPSKVDELIREAKKARAEGREFKFDYQKLLPDYDNPFQRKKEDTTAQEKDKEETVEKEDKYERHYTPKSDRDRIKDVRLRDMDRDKSKRKSDRYTDFRRHSDYRKSDRDRYKEKRSEKGKEREKEAKDSSKTGKSSEKLVEHEVKETDVNLNDYLVCDSWSLDNDDKTSSPQVEDKSNKLSTPVDKDNKSKEIEHKDTLEKRDDKEAYLKAIASPKRGIKIEKLQPVMDSFKYEIDPNDDEVLEVFGVDSKHEDFAKSKSKQSFDYTQDTMSDSLGDESFLESVINEIKQENMSDDDSQDKGLVEYDSPVLDFAKGQGTPELDESMRQSTSQISDYAESYRSTDSECKSRESGYKSSESGYRSNSQRSEYADKYKSAEKECKSVETVYKNTESGTSERSDCSDNYKPKNKDRKSADESGYKSSGNEYKPGDVQSKDFRLSVEKEAVYVQNKMSKETEDSLEMWNFVLKICQPLLFRHDKSKCYKETRTRPSVWWAEAVGGCGCVRGRGVVLGELSAQRMSLVDRVYGCDQISDGPFPKKRSWYPPLEDCLSENVTVLARSEGDGTSSPWTEPVTPMREDDLLLDREYQRFMEAVCDGLASESTTPTREQKDTKRRKHKLSSEGWSQESDMDEEEKRSKKHKGDDKVEEKEKEKKARKRKRSSSTLSTTTDEEEIKRKRSKKKALKKAKSKLAKRTRTEKKYLKKLKEKQKKKKKQAKVEKVSEEEEIEEPKKKAKDKKTKKKQMKQKKAQKKKKAKAKSSSSSSASSSSSDSDERRRKTKKKEKKKRQEDAFDVNILNNIKTEKLTDDEKCQNMSDQEFSPRRHQSKMPEIIDVKELQHDLGVQIKQEVVEESEMQVESEREVAGVKMDDFDLSNNSNFIEGNVEPVMKHVNKVEFKEPQDLTPQQRPAVDENLSLCSSQESVCSELEQANTRAEQPAYEKDESHLRPSSQNSNYSFNDVIASQSGLYCKGLESTVECEKFDGYEHENYEIYEQLAMAYQSDVASNQVPLPAGSESQRIETVSLRGEIKCDWRAGDAPARPLPRRSRWGLKPGEVNIVLTGGNSEHFASEQPVYKIESIANRNDNSTGYDEAYMDTYGAMDRLQYGDCFARPPTPRDSCVPGDPRGNKAPPASRRATLDDRIDQALRHSVLGDIAMEPENQDQDKESTDKGILITDRAGARGGKRVSFADGYKPGQDSDTEEPPVKRRKKSRRTGCAWPCPASHPDHVPLWDALPPPPPPPGSPPPPAAPPPPLHLLRRRQPTGQLQAPHPALKFDPNMPHAGFMPPEPPPGLITFT